MTTGAAIESWRSAWPDALAFAVGLAVAWWSNWMATGSLVPTVSGEEKPACKLSRDDDCRAKNRRDEFVILSGM